MNIKDDIWMITKERDEEEVKISRRGFIKGAALGAAIGVAATTGAFSVVKPFETPSTQPTSTPTPTSTSGPTPSPTKQAVENAQLLIHYDLCTGCMACAIACSEHWIPIEAPELSNTVNLEYSRIRPMRFNFVDVTNICHQCALESWAEGSSKHPCEQVCTPGAIAVIPKGQGKDGYYGMGYMYVDKSNCIGLDKCGRCLSICEQQFGSGITFDPNGQAQVCSMCGGLPVCADACPQNAIEVVVPGRNGRDYANVPEDFAKSLSMKLYKKLETI